MLIPGFVYIWVGKEGNVCVNKVIQIFVDKTSTYHFVDIWYLQYLIMMKMAISVISNPQSCDGANDPFLNDNKWVQCLSAGTTPDCIAVDQGWVYQ